MYKLYPHYKAIEPQIEFVADLDDEAEIRAIETYTSNIGYDINNALRSRNSEYQETVQHLDELFQRVPPLAQPIVTYRTIDYEITNDYSDRGYISTTIDKWTQQDELTCCTMIITIPAGTRVLPVQPHSVTGTEHEILLNRGGVLIHDHSEIRDNNVLLYFTYHGSDSSVVRKSELKQIKELLDPDLIQYLKTNLGQYYQDYLTEISFMDETPSLNNFIEYLKPIFGRLLVKKPFLIDVVVNTLREQIAEVYQSN